jgi:hypothetical protein
MLATGSIASLMFRPRLVPVNQGRLLFGAKLYTPEPDCRQSRRLFVNRLG